MLATQTRTDTKVDVFLVADLTDEQISSCKSLTLERGSMRPALERILHCKDPEVHNLHMKRSLETESVILVTIDGSLAAWALVQCSNKKTPATVFFFVSEDYRRRGLGTLLATEALSHWPSVKFLGWDRQSVQFFLTLPLPLTFHVDIRCGEDPLSGF
jgi:GNAT superfamily N-acetyltransferase